MEHAKKLEWLHKIAKLGLEHASLPEVQHLDAGGPVQPLGAPAPGVSGGTVPISNNGLIAGATGLLGLTNQYQAGAAPIQQGTNTSQLQNSYEGTQGALGQQQALVNQFQPGFVQGLGAQQTLSGQLGQQAMGMGPNPAQAALNEETRRNVSTQAALMAGQRGSSANSGLIARQIGQQGAAIQQQAVGQGATLQAQQQLAAQQAQQNLSAQQVAQGAAGVQGLNNAQQNEQNILQGANTSANNAAVGQQSGINQVNSGTARGNQGVFGQVLGGFASGAAAVAPFLAAKGGVVPKMNDHHDAVLAIYHPEYMAGGGLMVQPQAPLIGAQPGGWLSSNIASNSPLQIAAGEMNPALGPGFEKQFGDLGKALGGMKSNPSGEAMAGGYGDDSSLDINNGSGMDAYGNNSGLQMNAYKGGMAAKGGKVQAEGKKQQAHVSGDSLKNDKVPAMLSAGELVIDRETMNDPGQMGKMARALAMHIERRNKGGKK